jgi:hypothetical protein
MTARIQATAESGRFCQAPRHQNEGRETGDLVLGGSSCGAGLQILQRFQGIGDLCPPVGWILRGALGGVASGLWGAFLASLTRVTMQFWLRREVSSGPAWTRTRDQPIMSRLL